MVVTTQVTRKERERLHRRTAMLQAAQTVFAERGYSRATLDEVAQRAEFGKGTLYNYFPGGKEEILLAVFDQVFGEIEAHIIHAFNWPAASFREQMQRYVEEALHFFKEREALFMILVKEAHRMAFSEDEEKAGYFVKQRNRLVTALVEPLEAAMARGDIRERSPETVAHLILGLVELMQMHISIECQHDTMDGPPPTQAEGATLLTALLFEGLLPSSK
ncbi:MAG: TetR/AcrR family transcriptional regulator [Bacteroidota bacterium]